MFDAPLKAVHMMRLKSAATGEPSEYLSSFGTMVQPRRTPVKPAYFESELTSIAHVRAPGMSRIDLGTSSERMNGAYAASKTMIDPLALAQSTSFCSCAVVAAAPV